MELCIRAQLQRFFGLIILRLCVLFVFYRAYHEQCTHGQHRAEHKADHRVLHEAREDVRHEAQRRHGDGVWQLRCDMVEVVGLRAGRCHDGRVGDGGAVVAADCARAAGGYADDEQSAVAGENGGDDGNEYAERAP